MTWYENGMPVIDDPDVLATTELIRRLYAMPGGGLGGRLHVVLDDGNYEDEQINSGYYRTEDGRTIETYLCRAEFVSGRGWVHYDELECTPEMADICRLILASFRRMPESWRAASIAWFDGTIVRRLPALVADVVPPVSPEQVDQLIAELREEIARGDTPPEPKPCTPVPCPPFQDVTPSGGSRPEVKPGQRYVWTPRYAPHSVMAVEVLAVGIEDVDSGEECVEVRELVTGQCYMPTLEDFRQRATSLPLVPRDFQFDLTPPKGAPQWQYDAWKHWKQVAHAQSDQAEALARLPEVQRELMTKGEAFIQLADPQPVMREVRMEWRPDPDLHVDVGQILLHEANKPPKVLYRGAPPKRSVQTLIESWLANPEWDADAAPMIVGVPDGVDAAELTPAIALCQRAGLLPDTGILLIPTEMEGWDK